MNRRLMSQKLMPWHMAQARRQAVEFLTLPMAVSTVFFNTWISAYRPEPVRSHA